MSLKKYYKFEKVFEKLNLKNIFSIEQSILIAEDITLSENLPTRIKDELVKTFNENEISLLVESIKETFSEDFEENGVESDDVIDEEWFDEFENVMKKAFKNLHNSFKKGVDSVDDLEKILKKEYKSDRLYFTTLIDLVRLTGYKSFYEVSKLKDEELLSMLFKGISKVYSTGVNEGARPKRLTGAAKRSRDEKAQLMSLGNKDPEIKALKERAKSKIIQRLKALGKKNGIKVQRIDFTKIKL